MIIDIPQGIVFVLSAFSILAILVPYIINRIKGPIYLPKI